MNTIIVTRRRRADLAGQPAGHYNYIYRIRVMEALSAAGDLEQTQRYKADVLARVSIPVTSKPR